MSETGPNPHALCALPDGRWVSVLRGSSQLLVLDTQLVELDRSAAPAGAVACAVTPDGALLVVGERAAEVWRFHPRAGKLGQPERIQLPGALTPRAVVFQDRTAYVADAEASLLFEVQWSRAPSPNVRARSTCRGPIGLSSLAGTLVVNCLYDHSLVFERLDGRGELREERQRIQHDGPFWSVALLQRGSELWVAAGGVEDHPLQRFEGAFGYVDSFLFVYRVSQGSIERIHALNLSEQRLLVPKALAFRQRGDAPPELWVTGYGSERLLKYTFDEAALPVKSTTHGALQPIEQGSTAREPRASQFPFLPGITALQVDDNGRLLATSSLLDLVLTADPERAAGLQTLRLLETPGHQARARLGEALFFTEALAPQAESTGHKSRFTCETCHFEGGGDGRVHSSGRGAVKLSTRPLFGLLENGPHFSRALDRDLVQVAHNEFRVASLGSPQDPWFELDVARTQWLSELSLSGVGSPRTGLASSRLDPETLRGSLLDFLAQFEPSPNPRIRGRARFSAEEARGAASFHARCAGCHAARLFSDRPSSLVAYPDWEQWIFRSDGPVVWASDEYARTGVEPYVHERGARVPSLRRVVRKFPYFTNGSALSLGEVLLRFAWSDGRSHHARAPLHAERLSQSELVELQSFLELL